MQSEHLPVGQNRRARKEKMIRMEMRDKVFQFFNILMLLVFLPVLICVVFIGNGMDYNEGLKLAVLLPNYVLFLAAVCGMLICAAIAGADKIQLNRRVNYLTDGILLFLFVLLYFINFRVAREIAFQPPWDIMVVSSHGRFIAEGNKLGYSAYFSIYTNNIPMTWLLSRVYTLAMENKDYPYVYDFIWLQMNCILVSVGGMLSCLTVKKLTRKIVPTAICFCLYLALAGISPWKIAPYTDIGGLVFPVMCIWFYLCYRDAKKEIPKYLFLFFALAGGVLGSLIKPSALITVIAVFGVELIRFLAERGNWKYILAAAVFALMLFFAKGACMDYMMQELGLDFNEELEASWQYYFYMGLNEESTGSYSGDHSIYNDFQTSKRERDAEALDRAFERIAERGVLGQLWFWLRKMVMVFNDGLFGWGTEIWIWDYYPSEMAGNDGFTKLLRNIFWPAMAFTGKYQTFGQLAWIFCITGIPGICMCPKKERSRYAVMTISFLGIFFYQMLFEARARYLVVFWPLLIAVSVCGMWQYARMMSKIIEKRKNRREIKE